MYHCPTALNMMKKVHFVFNVPRKLTSIYNMMEMESICVLHAQSLNAKNVTRKTLAKHVYLDMSGLEKHLHVLNVRILIVFPVQMV